LFYLISEIYIRWHTTRYITLLREEIDTGIKLKEKDTKGFILQQDLCQLLQPFIYDSFSIENLNHLTKETYRDMQSLIFETN
jgi:hypothetical protein